MLNLLAAVLFFAQWMSAPGSSPDEEIWFRRTFRLATKPSSYHIAVACTEPFMVYADGKRVAPSMCLDAGYHDLEVQNPMIKSSAEVTVWTTGKARVWINLYGKDFSVVDDSEMGFPCTPWEWRRLPAKVFDANWSSEPWTIAWSPVERWQQTREAPAATAWQPGKAMRPRHMIKPSIVEDSDSTVTYDAHMLRSWQARVTFRGLKSGERLSINGKPYVATGQTDEQYISRGHVSNDNLLEIKGKNKGLKTKISNIEIFEVW